VSDSKDCLPGGPSRNETSGLSAHSQALGWYECDIAESQSEIADNQNLLARRSRGSRYSPNSGALVASVEKDGESTSSMVSFEGAQPWRKAGMVRARSKAGWRRLGNGIAERLDMAVSTPKYFRIIMPLMIVAVLGLLYLRLQPLLNSFKKYSNPKAVMLPDSSPVETGQSASERLATPAYLSSSPVETGQSAPERPATPAYLKTKAEAKVSTGFFLQHKRTYSNPLKVGVDFTGGAASEAQRYGRIKITSAITDTGEPLEVLMVDSSPPSDAQASFEVIDHSDNFVTKQPRHPQDGFRLEITLSKPTKEFAQVGSLAGTVTLQTIDPNRILRIENIGSKLSDPGEVRLHHPKLDALGEVSLVIHAFARDTAEVRVKGKRLQDVDVRIGDAHSNILSSASSSLGEDTKNFAFSVNSLVNARLEIILGYESIEAPFDVKNIVIQK